MNKTGNEESLSPHAIVRVLDRSVKGHEAQLRLATGGTIAVRRYFPAGREDILRIDGGSIQVLVKNDNVWIELGKSWSQEIEADFHGVKTKITFKEIETAEELSSFDELRKFHYRGGGGAGRTIPLIATSDLWDLPSVLGFVEISSSMIANTARKRFFDFPFVEPEGVRWKSWDREATKKYSNIICRISRFVIHPEIRGLGLAKYFTAAARLYARDRWHYGGFKARFLEITADMLRYYKFVDPTFAPMGNTEGNEHRLSQDMTYLIRKARTEQGLKAMPQGGGGIMTLQRGYAVTLLKYLEGNNRSMSEVISSLRYDASLLDQETWEALYRLNRRPKPCYVAGLTALAKSYVEIRRHTLQQIVSKRMSLNGPKKWPVNDIEIIAEAKMAQSADARNLQDTFGFVGADLKSTIIRQLSLELRSGDVTLICGASGSGKTILLNAIRSLLRNQSERDFEPAVELGQSSVVVRGAAEQKAKVAELQLLPEGSIPLELRGRASIEDFIKIAAKCGLAEPQMFVRSSESLSSGQRYRMQIALAFLRKPDVLLIDNFCEPLDRYTAIAVIKGVRQLARELDIAVVAATASYDRVLSLGEVDHTILLRRGDVPVIN